MSEKLYDKAEYSFIRDAVYHRLGLNGNTWIGARLEFYDPIADERHIYKYGVVFDSHDKATITVERVKDEL